KLAQTHVLGARRGCVRAIPKLSDCAGGVASRRGTYRDRHERWVRDAVDAAASSAQSEIAGRAEPRERFAAGETNDADRVWQNRVVLAPVAGVKSAEACRPDRARTRL